MNERIIELARQASSGPLRIEHLTPETEKFAELIIRECAELATKQYNNRGAIHGNDMLEHFGVEQ